MYNLSLCFFFLFSSSSRIAHEHLSIYSFFFWQAILHSVNILKHVRMLGFIVVGFFVCSCSFYIYPFVYSLFLINHFFFFSNVRYSWDLGLAIHELTQYHNVSAVLFLVFRAILFNRIRMQRRRKKRRK